MTTLDGEVMKTQYTILKWTIETRVPSCEL